MTLRKLLPSYVFLQELMRNYQVQNLVNEKAKSFRKRLDLFLQMRDHNIEGFRDPIRQRDLSIRFHWGHNHDFGDFALKGRMGDRHISLLARFIDEFGAISRSLEGLRVLDVGCWTGGTSLLLCAMGAQVVAIDEVKKYIDCLNYLKYAFGLQMLEVKNLSLYECAMPEFQNAFDIVLFAGVLYHITDPVLAMRLTFNFLKDGGTCLVETHAINNKENMFAYWGPSVCCGGRVEELNRSGWNWFIPSPGALSQMMKDVGYEEVRIADVVDDRAIAVGKRIKHVDVLRSGLSVRNVR